MSAALALVMALSVAACSVGGAASGVADTPGSPSPSFAESPEVDRDWDALRDQALAQEAQALGVEVPDDVEMVRYISIDEFGVVRARCLTEQGFQATATFDGGLTFTPVPDDQGEAQRIASMRCAVMYPVHPRYHQPPTEAQLRITYDYYVDELVPCLAAAGYDAGEPPTWETFRATYFDDGSWTPYRGVVATNPDPAAWQEINETCPQAPPTERLFGP
jgi:hypothetical protein